MPKQTKLYIEPEPISETAVRVLDAACSTKAPCGNKCVLHGRHRHRYHTCRDSHCQLCHDPARFGRARGTA